LEDLAVLARAALGGMRAMAEQAPEAGQLEEQVAAVLVDGDQDAIAALVGDGVMKVGIGALEGLVVRRFGANEQALELAQTSAGGMLGRQLGRPDLDELAGLVQFAHRKAGGQRTQVQLVLPEQVRVADGQAIALSFEETARDKPARSLANGGAADAKCLAELQLR